MILKVLSIIFFIGIIIATFIITFQPIFYYFMKFFDIFKWEDAKNIKVFIPQGNKYSTLTKECFEKWSQATTNNLLFNYINNKDESDIEVILKREFDSTEINWYDFTIGLTHYRFGPSENKMTIHIIERDYTVGKYLNEIEIKNTILHEIGHSIGLWKHSPNKNSIMYPITNNIKEILISEEEINRLRKIYKF